MGTEQILNDSEFKIRVLNELTKLDSKVERLSSHLESEVGNQERSTGRLEKTLEVLANNTKEENKKLYDFITGVHRDVFVGNGKPSVSTRLDRLEQKGERSGKHLIMIWTSIASIICSIIGGYLLNKINPKQDPQTVIVQHQPAGTVTTNTVVTP